MTIVPISSRASTHDAVTGATSEQRGSTQWVPPAQGEGGGKPPLSPEQVQATIWQRDNTVAGYLADEFCALLESNVYLPMTSNRKATVLSAMQSFVANLAMSYDPDWADHRDDDVRADCQWIESLVDEAWLTEVER